MPPAVMVMYCQCMEDIKRRIDVIRDLVKNIESDVDDEPMVELVFLQLRKILEQIAFASLTANREAYEQVRADVENVWNVKRLLDRMVKINPAFYPVPHQPPVTKPGGIKFFGKVSTGYMTKAQFVVLHDAASTILHTRNPFKKKNPVTHLGFSVDEWLVRIETLLKWHIITLYKGGVWVVEMHGKDGKVHVYSAEPRT